MILFIAFVILLVYSVIYFLFDCRCKYTAYYLISKKVLKKCVILNKVKNLNGQTKCIQILRFAQNDTSDRFLFLSRSFRNRSMEPMPSECGCLPVSDGFRAKQPRYVAMPMQNHSMCGKVLSSFQLCGNGTSSG